MNGLRRWLLAIMFAACASAAIGPLSALPVFHPLIVVFQLAAGWKYLAGRWNQRGGLLLVIFLSSLLHIWGFPANSIAWMLHQPTAGYREWALLWSATAACSVVGGAICLIVWRMLDTVPEN